MKRIPSTSFLALLLVAGAALPRLCAGAETPDKTPWKLTGDLEEACSCRAACPCWFKSLPSRMTCDGVQATFITKGRYGNTPLDGLAVVQFVQSPEHQSMFESFGKWNIDYVYIDEKANPAQREALKAVAQHLFPLGGKTREYKYTQISRVVDGAEHTCTVGKFGAFSGHLIEGGYAGAPKVTNPPLADPTHKTYQQGETTTLSYKDAGQDWKYEKSNYMYNQFKTDSKEYAKFEADMAKKMAAMQK